MRWVVVAAAVVWFAVASPRFRYALGVLIAIVIALGVAAYLWSGYQDQQRAKAALAAKGLIKHESIELFDMTMGISGPSVTLKGRVRNNDAAYSLTAVELRIRVLDCNEAQKCDVVGEAVEDVLTNVPPGQVRDVDEFVYFSGLGRERPGRRWTYDLLSVSAK